MVIKFRKLIELIYRFIYFILNYFLYGNLCISDFISPFSSIPLDRKKNIYLGKNCRINRNCILWCSKLYIENDVSLGAGVCIFGRVIIGSHVMIAPNVVLASGNHGITKTDIPMKKQSCTSSGPIIIEDDVWIGANAVILDGVKISNGAVIGAGSVVTKNVDQYSIVAGNPATIIKIRK